MNLDRNKVIFVKISNSWPAEFDDEIRFDKAVPDWGLIVSPHKDGKITDEEFEERYVCQLDKYKENIFGVIANLVQQHKDIIFLCWELPDKFCHRHIFTKYLNKNFGKEIVKEYTLQKDIGQSKTLF